MQESVSVSGRDEVCTVLVLALLAGAEGLAECVTTSALGLDSLAAVTLQVTRLVTVITILFGIV